MIPDTSTTLLRNVSDTAHPRWPEFVAKYRPMMAAFLRERFPSLDADDIIQETFAALCKVLPNYQYSPDEKGHFRNYLTGILRNKAQRALRTNNRQARIMELAETSAGRARSPSAPQCATQDDDQSWRESVFEIALHRFLSDETFGESRRTITGGSGVPPLHENQTETRYGVGTPGYGAPVLDGSAQLGGVEAKDVRWFLDDLPVDLPHAFVHGSDGFPDWMPRRLCAVALRWIMFLNMRSWNSCATPLVRDWGN